MLYLKYSLRKRVSQLGYTESKKAEFIKSDPDFVANTFFLPLFSTLGCKRSE